MFFLTCNIFKLDQKTLFSSNSGCFYTPKRCMHEHRLILKNNSHTCFYCFRFHEDDIQIQIKVAPLGSQSTSVQNVILATIICEYIAVQFTRLTGPKNISKCKYIFYIQKRLFYTPRVKFWGTRSSYC